jgi:hypothetical protein
MPIFLKKYYFLAQFEILSYKILEDKQNSISNIPIIFDDEFPIMLFYFFRKKYLNPSRAKTASGIRSYQFFIYTGLCNNSLQGRSWLI